MTRDISELREEMQDPARLLINRVKERFGLDMRPTSTYRTLGEQAILYAQGRTAYGKVVTNAKPGWSWHNHRLAMDCAIWLPDGSVTWDAPWDEIHDMADELSFGPRNRYELGHFDMRLGYTIHEMAQALGPLCAVCAGKGMIPCPACGV